MKKQNLSDISGVNLEKEELIKHIKNIALEYEITKNVSSKTYPIKRIKKDFKIISETYDLLDFCNKKGIRIHSAGEWILDNFYIIEENVKSIEKDLSQREYRKLPGIEISGGNRIARIYMIALELVKYNDSPITQELIEFVISAYQNEKNLCMEEIWKIALFIKCAIIQKIAKICTKIYESQIQKIKVENIVYKTIENDPNKEIKIKDEYIKNKYAFIEYLSFRLKQYGATGINYRNVLESQIKKMGLDINEIVKREHIYVARLKVSIGNSIKSLKDISRINLNTIFENINKTEELLNQDPYKLYSKLTEETKVAYRNSIKKLADKNNVAEIYVAEEILRLAEKYVGKDERKSHIGYFLIDDGREEIEKVLNKNYVEEIDKETKIKMYVVSNFLIPIGIIFLISFLIDPVFKNVYNLIYLYLFLSIPVMEIYIKIGNYILSKLSKVKVIPKIEYEDEIPEENSTFVVIPCIINNIEKIDEMIEKLEVYYLANREKNLFFALLGDVEEANTRVKKIDYKIIENGLEKITKLNEKYQFKEIPKFYFLYRKRKLNSSEKKYIGWERKRGLLSNFNEFLLTGKSEFRINTVKDVYEKIPKIKYIITIDSDTNLVLNSAKKLIGTAVHVLNKPVVENGKVIKGYGIIQPRVGIDTDSYRKTKFTQIFAMQGGIDFYSNSISDVYNDCFDDAIYTGKGLYDVEVYEKVLKNEIPQNVVLSHDLLEGCYLKVLLASDVVLMDNFPNKFNSYIARNNRWIRGDIQISKWLFSEKLDVLSKYKIFDNIRRALVPISILILLIISNFFRDIKTALFITGIIAVSISGIIDLFNYILFKESYIEGSIYAYKKYTNEILGIKNTVYNLFMQISILPTMAIENGKSICKSIYRMIKNKKMLEWTTSEETERYSKTDLCSYITFMKSNIIFGIIFLFLEGIQYKALGMLWLIGPFVCRYISLEEKKKEEINIEEKQELINIGKRTWEFFENNIIKENNYLMPDNYQENRKMKLVENTSSTNIGLELLSIISAFDLGYIEIDTTEELLAKVINIVKKLSKWNGHLYNWYNIKTLEPLNPKFVSTVDSGNFIGYLYIVKRFFEENFKENILMINEIDSLIKNTDFSKLYSDNTRLLSIGFLVDENKLIDSYYDFLASEARLASLVAIAKKDIPEKHWNNLSRTLTTLDNYKGLISWSGTAFEYLMPNINVKRYKGSLLDESLKFSVESQKAYSKKFGLPWGISESAYNIKDLKENYQYKAFGIPWLGVKRGLGEEYVVSPYSTFLSLEDSAKDCMENINVLKKYGAYGEYGFYESIDFTSSRNTKGKKYEVVKTYMAHHQGLILNSINNYLNNNVIRERFNKNPEIQAVNILLQERMPKNVILTKEKKEKIEKIKTINELYYYEKSVKDNSDIAIISGEKYFIYLNLKDGSGYSKYNNEFLYKYKEGTEYFQGVQLYIRNLKNKKIYNMFENSEIVVNLDKIVVTKKEGNYEFKFKIGLDADKGVEIRDLKIKNNSRADELFEIIFAIEPVLSEAISEYSHPMYNKMFIKCQKDDDILFFTRKDKNCDNKLSIGMTLYTESEKVGDLEYEIDREKYFGRDNFKIPKLVEDSNGFSSVVKCTVDYIGALKQIIKVKKESHSNVTFLMVANYNIEEIKENINSIKKLEEIQNAFEISKAKLEEEQQYLRVKERDIKNYYEIIQLLFKSKEKIFKQDIEFSINDLWKFGISGDNKIVVLNIKSIEDRSMLREILKMYEYLRIKSIDIDLVVINNEKSVYERIVKEEIEKEIMEKQMQYLLNKKIFIINRNEVSGEEIEKIELASDLIINAEIGNLKNYIEQNKRMRKQILKEYENTKINNFENTENEIDIPKDIKYFNEYGGFLENGKEYFIKTNSKSRLPAVWSNILCNQFFGSLVDENMGGFTWYKNSRLNRITVWRNDVVQNLPSEIIFIKDLNNGKKWSLNSNLSENESGYYCVHGFGYSKYLNLYNDILSETTIFVPKNDSVKIMNIRLKNNSNEKRNIKLLYYLKPVLGDDDYYSNRKINIVKKENLIYLNRYDEKEIYKSKKNFVCFSENINSYTGDKEFFIGNKSIYMPEAIDFVQLDNKDSMYKDSCLAVQINVEIDIYREKELVILLGKENEEDIANICNKYFQKTNDELEIIKKEWETKLSNIKVKTPLESFDIMINGWALYQTLAARFYSKTGFYQSGGAIGFRDQLQDSLALKYIDNKYLENQILLCCRHQFVEGDVLHWWHEDNKAGIRTRFSDDLLWLVYAVLEYIDYTNDYEILEKEEFYLTGKKLEENEIEKYNTYYQGDYKENVYIHCVRAIEKVELGENGIPKIGSGDWNDGFSNLGVKGKGESIWLGFFYYDILNRFIKICEKKEDIERKEEYEVKKRNLKKVLNDFGWDGNWYKRAISDNGEVIGSSNSNECRIDSISQSWSVISEAGDNDKKYIALDSVYKNLVDKENKIIKLFTPSFEKDEINPGYIKSYPPGVRENGGQYTHAAIWYGIANAILGFGDNAIEIFSMINPIERTKTKEEAKRYKVEPYVLVADIYSNEDMKGRGGWSWYTGSSSWYYKFAIEYILGLKIKDGKIKIDPCISSKWREYYLEYNYKKTVYKIRVKNQNSKMKGVSKVIVNGEEIKEKEIKMIDDGNIYEIDVIM